MRERYGEESRRHTLVEFELHCELKLSVPIHLLSPLREDQPLKTSLSAQEQNLEEQSSMHEIAPWLVVSLHQKPVGHCYHHPYHADEVHALALQRRGDLQSNTRPVR